MAVALRSADLICLTGVLLFAVAFFAFAERAEDRLAAGLAGTAFFLVLFTQRFYLYDRMNTFFKLYLESWLLFAVATAALAFRPPEARGSISRWPAALRGVAAFLAILSLFTTVTAARGALDDARPSRKEGAPIPTLDGLAYLEKAAPGRVQGRDVAPPHGARHARPPRGAGPLVPGLRPHLDVHGPADGPRLGVPRAAARQLLRRRSRGARSPSRPSIRIPSADAIEGLLRRYHVAYVYVGPLERRTYPRTGLAKFDAARNLFTRRLREPAGAASTASPVRTPRT